MFIGLFSNPLVKYLTAALTAVLLLGGAYVKGRSDGSILAEAAVTEERQKWELAITQKQAEYDTKIEQLMAGYKQRSNRYQAEIKRLKDSKVDGSVVNTYIPKQSDVVVPKGFVDLHNTAVAGNQLQTTPAADASEPSSKKLSDVGTTVASNYYHCNDIRDQLIALQKVVEEFQGKQKELPK